MSTASNPQRDRERIPAEEALGTLRSTLTSADEARVGAYARLIQLRVAKGNLLAQQQRTLALKLGEQHPRVLQLGIRRDLNQEFLPELRMMHTQTATAPPNVTKEGYTVHGFVRTARGEPVPRATVTFYDSAQKIARDLGPSTTDRNGHFSQSLVKAPVAGERADVLAYEIRVLNERKGPFGHASVQIEPKAGGVDFVDIRVEAEGEPIQRPPPRRKPRGASGQPAPPRQAQSARAMRSMLRLAARELREAAASSTGTPDRAQPKSKQRRQSKAARGKTRKKPRRQ